MYDDPVKLLFLAQVVILLLTVALVMYGLALLILNLLGYELDQEPKLDVDFMKRLDKGEVLTADNMFSKYEN